MTADKLSRSVAGRVVSRIVTPRSGSLAVCFTDGSMLLIAARGEDLAATIRDPDEGVSRTGSGPQPTGRQREYLTFMRQYVARYGVAPAEADIARHFMVSAPSVNAMMQNLERRGFITRDRDLYGQAVPRSIRIVWNAP
jgi:hypothetical protein